jgi:redox-sensitive bicupin YhaK (pirin superfamily)
MRSVVQSFRAHSAPVGDFSVLRALPQAKRRHVGPFVFLDHFGPTTVKEGRGIPAHPHAGIEVITYLFEGSQVHRDSIGNENRVGAGGAQWITAGRGIIHAEKPDVGTVIHGVQIWSSLPIAQKHIEPRYHGVQAEDVPTIILKQLNIRLLCGTLPFVTGPVGPITLAQPALLAHLKVTFSVTIGVPPGFELGLYHLTGQIDVYSDGDSITLEPGEYILLGGDKAEAPLLFGGPFVMDTPDNLQRAQRDFQNGIMGTLDGVPF